MQLFVVVRKFSVPVQRRFCRSHRKACQQPQIASANPTSAPTSGRVSSVTAITTAPAIPIMTTHLKTAASLRFISVHSPQGRTNIEGGENQAWLGRREGGKGSALRCVTRR